MFKLLDVLGNSMAFIGHLYGFLRWKNDKMLSYRRETARQGALQFSPKVEDCNWETIFYGHCSSRSFKVIEVGTNPKPVCDFLLVINSNW